MFGQRHSPLDHHSHGQTLSLQEVTPQPFAVSPLPQRAAPPEWFCDPTGLSLPACPRTASETEPCCCVFGISVNPSLSFHSPPPPECCRFRALRTNLRDVGVSRAVSWAPAAACWPLCCHLCGSLSFPSSLALCQRLLFSARLLGAERSGQQGWADESPQGKLLFPRWGVGIK